MSAAAATPTALPTNMTPEQRRTYNLLVSDGTPWTMAEIAVGLDVQPQTVRSWRKDSLAKTTNPSVPHPNHLPDPDIPVSGKPTWKAGTVRRWAIQTGRMSVEGTPKRLKPPGRPRTERAAA